MKIMKINVPKRLDKFALRIERKNIEIIETKEWNYSSVNLKYVAMEVELAV